MYEERVGHVSRRDATVACLVSAMLGAVLTAVVLIGSDIPLKCIDGGNAADWLAALGTWIIGYGAWTYTREAHIHRVKETASTRRRENLMLLSRLRAVRNKVLNVGHVKTALDREIRGVPEEERTLIRYEAYVRVAMEIVSRIDFSAEEKAILAPGAIDGISRIDYNLIAYMDFCRRFVKEYPDPFAEILVEPNWFSWIAARADILGEEVEATLALVDAQMRGVEEAMATNASSESR